MAIGFVTIEDLVIQANWPAGDVANSNGATEEPVLQTEKIFY